MLINSTGIWCADQKGWDSKEWSINSVSIRRRCANPHGWWDVIYCISSHKKMYIVYPHVVLYRCIGHLSILEEFNLNFFISFCKFGEDSSSPSCTSLPIFNTYFVPDKKKKICHFSYPWSCEFVPTHENLAF